MCYFVLFQHGHKLKDDELETLFWKFKALAGTKKVKN